MKSSANIASRRQQPMKQRKIMNDPVDFLTGALKIIRTPMRTKFLFDKIYEDLKHHMKQNGISIAVMTARTIWVPDNYTVTGTYPTIVDVS
jgi:hypothetical protein